MQTGIVMHILTHIALMGVCAMGSSARFEMGTIHFPLHVASMHAFGDGKPLMRSVSSLLPHTFATAGHDTGSGCMGTVPEVCT